MDQPCLAVYQGRKKKEREYWVSQKKGRSDKNPRMYRKKSGPNKARLKEEQERNKEYKKQKKSIESMPPPVDIKYQVPHPTLASPHPIVAEEAAQI